MTLTGERGGKGEKRGAGRRERGSDDTFVLKKSFKSSS